MGAVRLPPGLVSAILVRRLNRFAVEVELEGKRAQAHLANSGRLQELMLPGAPVLLVPKDAPGRKTAYDLALVCRDGLWVSADARLPNALFREALAQGRLAEFAGCRVARAEVVYGGTRLDFLLEGLQGPLLVETKSVTLVEEGVGLFPDAPTERGRRHLEALAQAAAAGLGAAVVFVVQRADAGAFAPHRQADPRFARALAEAAAAGVRVLAYRCCVDPRQVSIAAPIPVRL
jgi:sugar fermentation stimulation protein A